MLRATELRLRSAAALAAAVAVWDLPQPPAIVLEPADIAALARAWPATARQPARIELSTRYELAPPELLRLLAHEVGHVLGVGHVPAVDAVMSGAGILGATGTPVLTADDLAALAAAHPPPKPLPTE